MTVADYSKHQQKIIKNYYDNREAISLQRLSELVTELYLAEGKARQKHWKSIVSAHREVESAGSADRTSAKEGRSETGG